MRYPPPAHRGDATPQPTRRRPNRRRGRKPATGWRRARSYFVDLLVAVVVLSGAAAGVGAYLLARFEISSGSMEPTLTVGQTYWAVRLMDPPNRFDIVAFPNPANPNEILIKRVLGMPGDQIEAFDGIVHVNFGALDESVILDDVPYTPNFAPVSLGPNEYYLLGDNRENSIDSRTFGPVNGDVLRHRLRLPEPSVPATVETVDQAAS